MKKEKTFTRTIAVVLQNTAKKTARPAKTKKSSGPAKKAAKGKIQKKTQAPQQEPVISHPVVSHTETHVTIPSSTLPVPIKRIITTAAFSAARGYGIWLVRKFGEKLFPGIEKAEVKFVVKDPDLTEAEYDTQGTLPIGIGNGRFGAQDSATTLVTRYLGIEKGAAYDLAQELEWADKNKGARHTQLSYILKSAHRTIKNGERQTLIWLLQTFDVLWEQLTFHFGSDTEENSLLVYLEGAKKTPGWIRSEALSKELHERISESVKRTEEYLKNPRERSALTEIDYITRAMQKVGKSTTEIWDWIRFVFNRIQDEQTLFFMAVKECRDKKFLCRTPAMIDGERLSLNTCCITTDNPMMLPASRYCKQDLLLVRNSANQVQIFLSFNSPLTLDNAIAFIRWMELPIEDKKKYTWKQLQAAGVLADAPHWFYHKRNQQIFNGSATTPGTSPTEISFDVLRVLLISSFHPKLIYSTKARLGIELEEEESPIEKQLVWNAPVAV